MSSPVLSVERLSRAFTSGRQRVSVLSGLTLSVFPGESLAVVGRSGSGKSTLLNLLCGLQVPDEGRITVMGESFDGIDNNDIDARWAELRRRSIGVVFQEANLMPALSLVDNVRLRANLAGRGAGGERGWLERLGVGAEADRYPDQVSGGQAQRAALAMVFAMSPALILADEPTGSLDRQTADEVADCLFAMQRDTGCALVLATHDTGLASRCDHLLDLSASTARGTG
ncbi:ATP-binding cassette domain-containing protein [Marinobacter sp. TBZ242]|uniref:ATP-binding cassette domain-containing protein n=1 Tax=Marinobacter azerbaijanicus TaxID=3050455 RepID=A0ABT7ICK2_9GAMM|nr:ATP-binding cassette domain-containing protein [Marinobacter sp. TBZ242]MDL0431886.1 ATP-binding cassette domain-containing protein [Marinobacter sp. TBZ242]